MDHQTSSVPPIAYDSPQSLTQPLTEFPQMDSGLAVPVFNQGDDPIAYDRVTIQTSSRGWQGQSYVTEDLDAYDSDCDDVSNAKAILMANLFNYGSDVILEEKLALKQEIDSLEQNISNQIKEKGSLLQTFTILKNESKEKESKYMDKEIDLEKKIKEMDNIVYKVGQSAQTVHMLTKPQVFYDDTHKQALGYQNTFYLKKAQWIKPTLYDGSLISSKHAASPMIDDEETLILEEVGRSKMLAKQNNTMSKEKKVNTTPINYVELNRLSEDFGKRFVP
ncbi:hypothetical protein Tco_1421019 [Tanacetum coccineum]